MKYWKVQVESYREYGEYREYGVEGRINLQILNQQQITNLTLFTGLSNFNPRLKKKYFYYIISKRQTP